MLVRREAGLSLERETRAFVSLLGCEWGAKGYLPQQEGADEDVLVDLGDAHDVAVNAEGDRRE